MEPRQRLAAVLTSVAAVLVFGTLGLIVLEGWSPFDALYMAVITVSTVGFGEVHRLSTTGRAFILVLILLGTGTVFYSLTTLAELLIEQQVAPAVVRRRRMRQKVRRMKNHVIVCGYGRVGSQVAAELAREGVPVVVIDSDPAAIERCTADGLAGIQGDGTEEAVLAEAGIAQARGLVVTTNSDANNVYVTLVARSMRADLYIVARQDRDEAAPRLAKAGADRVISPYHLGGRRMAALVLRPAVVDFVDTLLGTQRGSLLMEEVLVRQGAPLAGLTLSDLRRLGLEVSVLAIVKQDRSVLVSPPAPTIVGVGDLLIVLGRVEELRRLERHCSPAQA